MLAYPILQFQIKTNRQQSINNVGYVYSVLVNLGLMVMVLCQLLEIDDRIVVGILVLLYLLRSLLILLRINFYSIEIEYCSLLGELYSWLMISMLCIRVFYSLSIEILCWANLLLFVYLTLYPNTQLTNILQFKYIKAIFSFSQRIKYSEDGGLIGSRNTSTESELIQMFVCFLYYAKSEQLQNGEYVSGCKSVVMSKHFKAHVRGVIEMVIQRKQKGSNNSNKNHNAIKQISQKQHNNFLLSTSKQPQQNKWSLLYKALQSINQLQQQGYTRLRRLIIYHFPIINSTTNHKLLRLHYLNVDYCKKQKYSYIRQIDNAMTHKFLTEKMMLEFKVRQKRPLDAYEKDGSSLIDRIESSYAVKGRVHNRPQSIAIKNETNNMKQHQSKNEISKYPYQNNSSFSYCLKLPYQELKPLSYFNLYYQQTQIEQTIHSKLQKVFSIQKEIISLAIKRENNKELLKNLVRKYQQTRQIKEILQSIHNTYQIKSIMYKFILEYWVMNCPHVAINNLKMSNFKDLFTQKVNKPNNFFRKGTVLIMNNSRPSTIKGNDKYQKMITFVSGIKSFGKIVDCCEVFKEKMQLWTIRSSYQKDVNPSVDKLSIYDIMLPLWAEKHMQISQGLFMMNTNKFTHQSTKVHLVSCHQKKIYECGFNIYPIISNKQDLLLALDINYKEVQKLCIYRNQHKIFSSMTNNRHTNKTRIVDKLEHDDDDMLDEGNCIRTTETIFDEEYVLLKRYKRLQKSRYSERNRTNSRNRTKIQLQNNPFAKSINPQITSVNNHGNQTTTWTFKSTSSVDKMMNSRLQNEIKMNQYLKATLFYSLKLKFFSLMHWSIPPFIMSICLFLYFYTNQQLLLNDNIQETKIATYQKFLIVDTHILTDLYYMKLVSENVIEDGEMWTFLLEDIKFNNDFIYNREGLLQHQLSSSYDLAQIFLQHGQSPTNTSVYFEDLNFDISAQDYLKNIGFNTQTINQSQNLQTIYAQIKSNININRFFNQFKNRYQGYFNSLHSIAIIPAIQQLQAQRFQYSETFFFGVIISLIILISFAALIFALVYFDLQYHVQKLVLTCLDLPIQQLKNAYAKITQSKCLLQNSKQSIPNNIIQKIRSNPSNENDTSFTPSQSAKQLIVASNAKKIHLIKPIHDTFCQTIYKCLPQLLSFCLIIIILQSCLILLITKLKANIVDTQNFSNSVQKLTGLTALSNKLTMEILLKLQNLSTVENTQVYLHEYFSAEKMSFINDFVLDSDMQNQLIFKNICNINNTSIGGSICPHYNPALILSYAEVISSNYRLFKQLFFVVDKQQTQPTSQFFASLSMRLLNLIKRVSLFNRYTHEMIIIGRQNLQTNLVNPAVYFALIIVEMTFVVLSFNWFTYERVYKMMKIYYNQAFTICPLHQMQKHRELYFYLNQAKQHKIISISESYELSME